MPLFGSFFNSVHSEARIWMQSYVRKYNRAQTDHWMSQGRTSEFIKTELQRKKNHRQWATFNGYYSLVKTITFLVLFTLICFTLYGYHCWGVEFSNYPKYWLSIYVYGILGALLLQLFGMFFACLILHRELSLPFTSYALISNPLCRIYGVIRRFT